jgi:hypothetical protein
MPGNVPDDDTMYWHRCSMCGQDYYDGDGEHECEEPEEEAVEPERDWLKHSGYEFDDDSMNWSLMIRISSHTARRDHKDGRIKKGQYYQSIVTRHICDVTGRSWLDQSKCRIIGK